MARISFRRLITENQLEVVAMRTDKAHTPLDFLGARLRQPAQERGLDQFEVVTFGHRAGSANSAGRTSPRLLRYRRTAGRDSGAMDR